jgi:hypothetical protein
MKTVYKHCDQCNTLHDASAWPHEAQVEAKYDPSANYDEYLNGPRAGRFLTCQVCGDLHNVYDWPDNHMPEQFDLAHEYAGIATISDSLENYGLIGVQNQADGRHYTSKAKLRADYRARGMIEMGNDKQAPFKRPKPDRKEIRDAIRKAANAVEYGAKVENYRKQSKASTAFGRVAKA